MSQRNWPVLLCTAGVLALSGCGVQGLLHSLPIDDLLDGVIAGAGGVESGGCPFQNDGECDDGRVGSVTSICAPDTDPEDCDGLDADFSEPTDEAVLVGGCPFRNDGECDDGRTGSVTGLCDFGSDPEDCDNMAPVGPGGG